MSWAVWDQIGPKSYATTVRCALVAMRFGAPTSQSGHAQRDSLICHPWIQQKDGTGTCPDISEKVL